MAFAGFQGTAPDTVEAMSEDSQRKISDAKPPASGEQILRVEASRLPEAIQALVQGDKAAAQRFLEYARESTLRLDLVWSLLDASGRIDATVLVAPAAGRTAMLFASRPSSAGHTDRMGHLIHTAVGELASTDIVLAQVLLDPGASEEHEIFQAGGFLRLANLDYLERPIPRFQSIKPPQFGEGVSIEQWDPRSREEMISLLDRSYEETLDCPGLTGMRRTEDILEGHIASGIFTPEWWHLLRVDGRPEGVLLFNRAHDGETIELVYLGISREIRGRGLGRVLLTHGLAALDSASGRAIVLAVDRNNAPAVRLYRRAGFRVAVKRVAFVRQVPT